MKKLILILSLFSSLTSFNVKYNHVFDYEYILTKTQKETLNDLYSRHESLTTNQIALITTSEIGDAENIQDYATKKGNELGVGQKEKDNGIIIVFSNTLRKTSIATGLGTENILTDSIAKHVIDNIMIPYFKEGKNYKGIYSGSKWITDFLEKPENKITTANTKSYEK